MKTILVIFLAISVLISTGAAAVLSPSSNRVEAHQWDHRSDDHSSILDGATHLLLSTIDLLLGTK